MKISDRALIELLRDIADSGVAFDDPRLNYVEVQIDRDVWERLIAAQPTELVPRTAPTFDELYPEGL